MSGTNIEAELRRQIDSLQQRVAELETALHACEHGAIEPHHTKPPAPDEAELRATLYSIGDAVIATDSAGRVVRMNPVAERLTDWAEAEALGQPLDTVFRIVNETTRVPAENPVVRVLREGIVVGLSNHTLLLAKDGRATPIADSAAPIRDVQGNSTGVVLVFRDQSAERLTRRLMETRLSLIEYAANHTLDELLPRTLDEVETIVESSIGFYYTVVPDQRTLSLQQWLARGLELSGQHTDAGLYDDIDQTAIWLDCVTAKRPVIRNNSVMLPYMNDTPEGRAVARRAMAAPVMHEGEVIAILGVANKPTDYTEQDAEIVAYLADVSWQIIRQKQVEEALRESEERFRHVYEHMAVGVARVSLDFLIEGANDAYCQMLGYREEDLIGKHLRDITHPEILEENLRKQAQLATGAIDHYRMEKQFIHKSGRVIYGILDANLIRDANGEPVYFLGSVLDITERKQAEEALRESEARYRMLFEVANDFVLLHHFDIPESPGCFIEVNQLTCQRLGYSLEELRRLRPTDIVTAENLKDIPAEAAILASDKELIFEKHLVAKDGTSIPVELHSRVFEYQGQTLALSIGRDISERKQAEAEKARLEEQVRQAQKMEAIGRLAGGVAHDFNNMLGVILGHTELAMEEIDASQPLFADLEEIRKAAERSASLTRQLLAFARKQAIAPRTLDLNETVEGMLMMLRRLIGEDINLVWQPKTGLWPIRMDPSQIDQLLANLCINARDAIAGVGAVTITTDSASFDEAYCARHTSFAPGEFVVLTVSDDGQGMNQTTLGHIFEPFFTTKGFGQGTGLGLATVYGIVTQNQGFIHVDSAPGRGATFTIYLPRHQAQDEPQPAESSTSIAVCGEETILLVEDEPAILDIGQMMLERLGYKVLVAATPHEAIKAAEGHSGVIDLLITDVIMPGMNGYDLAQQVRDIYPEIRCLFMSGYTANVVAKHGVLEKGFFFIQKPFSMKALAAQVREALDSASSP